LTIALVAAGGGGSSFLLIIVVVFALMWFFMIRPQRARQRAQQDQLRSVGPGTEIVTTGGLIGTVVASGDDELTLEIAPGTNVRVARRAVAGILTQDEAEDEEEEEEDEVVDEAYDEGDEVDEAPEVAAGTEPAEPKR
jgi:preprotein translocase subunit YajC